MFAKGDLVQFIGYPADPADFFEFPPLPLKTITTVVDVRDFDCCPHDGFGGFYIKPDKCPAQAWHHHSGFRLISKPDPLLASREASIPVINFTTEPA